MSENASSSAATSSSTPLLGRDPTVKEGALAFAVLACNAGPLDIDWATVATRLGYANGNSARARFYEMKRSLAVPADGTSTATPVKPRAKKDKGDTTNPTPSKVKKTATPRKKKPTKKEMAALEAAAADMMTAPASSSPSGFTPASAKASGGFAAEDVDADGDEDDEMYA